VSLLIVLAQKVTKRLHKNSLKSKDIQADLNSIENAWVNKNVPLIY